MTSAHDRQRRRVVRYYRWLDRLEQHGNDRRAGDTEALPVHRALRDPAGAEPPSAMRVHGMLLEGLDLPPEPRVLDAGCGYGATALDLLPRLGGHWTGVTLSPVQIERGRREAAHRRLTERLDLRLQSYDDPLPGGFDLVVGIESLIHSAAPSRTIANLAGALKPGGWLVMVDDMPEANLAPADARDVALFRRMWRCPVAPSRDGWVTAMQMAGLELVHERDLSTLTLARGPEELSAPLARQKRRAFWLGLLGRGLREEADIGGMTLELLLRRGAMRYRLLAARKRVLGSLAETAQEVQAR